MLVRDVDPELVDFQEGDLSRETAPRRAVSVHRGLRERRTIKPPMLRQKAGGRFEVWDGNARVFAYKQLRQPFDAIIVGPTGQPLRAKNADVPLDQAYWDELVARARGLVDAGKVPFRWPSPQAHAWIQQEYVAGGGRFGTPRRPRARPAQERQELARYRDISEAVVRSRSLDELAQLVRRARVLDSLTLRETLELDIVARARELGLSCPVKASHASCADRLLEQYGETQQQLLNPKIGVQANEAAKKFARWGLEARRAAPKSRKGGLSTREAGEQGIGSGVARARDIIAGKNVDAAQVKAYFDRHEGYYKKALTRAKRSKLPLRAAAEGEPAIQGWWLWGGDPMRKLAERAVKRHKAKLLK